MLLSSQPRALRGGHELKAGERINMAFARDQDETEQGTEVRRGGWTLKDALFIIGEKCRRAGSAADLQECRRDFGA